MIRLCMIALLLTACSGCATRTTTVGQRMFLPEGAASYAMQDHQAFVFPVPHANPPPDFPPDYPLRRELPPTTVCISLVVDEAGAVGRPEPQPGTGCAMAEEAAPLYAAVLARVRQWRFDPAMFCSYPDAATRDRDWNGRGCSGAVTEARVVPVSLSYAFTFEVRNGERKVASAPH